MPRFGSFDQRNYETVPAREGYAQWAETYEQTIKHDMDVWLLEELQSVGWNAVRRCADLGCGTGRSAAWLASKGVPVIDGVDATPEMLSRARERETHVHLLSDHVTAALAAGWRLAELREQVIDDRWVKTKPSWAAYRDVPISFACVWRR